MLRNVYLKTLYSLRWQLLGWTAGIGFIVFLTVIVFDSLAGSGFANITKTIPSSLQSLVGSIEDFASMNGYIGQFVFGSKTTPFLLPMALILFLGQSVSEEDDGRLASLLALPISRSRVYFQKWLAVASVVITLCILMALVALGSAKLIHHSVDLHNLIYATMSCALMCLGFGTLAFMLGMATGRKTLAIGLASAYAAGSLLLSSIAPNIDSLKVADRFSLLHYYNLPNIMLHGLSLHHTIVLAAFPLGCLLLGWWMFTRRSIQTG